jgi:hypothetical protein
MRRRDPAVQVEKGLRVKASQTAFWEPVSAPWQRYLSDCQL